MHDCALSFAHEGKDLDPTETNCCTWVKPIYFSGWKGMEKNVNEICGLPFPPEKSNGMPDKEACCGRTNE